jgi:hypothetical protein
LIILILISLFIFVIVDFDQHLIFSLLHWWFLMLFLFS